jgi:hypothetical protein
MEATTNLEGYLKSGKRKETTNSITSKTGLQK